jgi:hypothetical protein
VVHSWQGNLSDRLTTTAGEQTFRVSLFTNWASIGSSTITLVGLALCGNNAVIVGVALELVRLNLRLVGSSFLFDGGIGIGGSFLGVSLVLVGVVSICGSLFGVTLVLVGRISVGCGLFGVSLDNLDGMVKELVRGGNGSSDCEAEESNNNDTEVETHLESLDGRVL